MITRIVKTKIKKESYKSFLKYMETFVSETRNFENNHHTDFFEDKEEPFRFHIYTIWKNQTALNKFRSSEINKMFIEKLNLHGETKYVAWTVQNTRK